MRLHELWNSSTVCSIVRFYEIWQMAVLFFWALVIFLKTPRCLNISRLQQIKPQSLVAGIIFTNIAWALVTHKLAYCKITLYCVFSVQVSLQLRFESEVSFHMYASVCRHRWMWGNSKAIERTKLHFSCTFSWFPSNLPINSFQEVPLRLFKTIH